MLINSLTEFNFRPSLLVEFSGADRENRQLFKNWVERHAIVLCFEHAAMRQPNVKDEGGYADRGMSETRPPITAGPMERAFRFLKRASVNGGAVGAEGELLGAANGGVVLSGEVSGRPGRRRFHFGAMKQVSLRRRR